ASFDYDLHALREALRRPAGSESEDKERIVRRPGVVVPLPYIPTARSRDGILLPWRSGRDHAPIAGKRWRQEYPDNPSVCLPVIPNHFVFRNMTIDRFLGEWRRSRPVFFETDR